MRLSDLFEGWVEKYLCFLWKGWGPLLYGSYPSRKCFYSSAFEESCEDHQTCPGPKTFHTHISAVSLAQIRLVRISIGKTILILGDLDGTIPMRIDGSRLWVPILVGLRMPYRCGGYHWPEFRVDSSHSCDMAQSYIVARTQSGCL